MTVKSLQIKISIDRGGTFTDVHASVPGRDDIILKLLSVDPANYKDAPTEGIRRILELATGQPHPRGELLDLYHVESIRMGTTVATNALLERKGERTALLITRGFRDLLAIGNQSRPDIFDLSITRPEVLYERVVEVDERITMEDYTEDPQSRKTTPAADDTELATAITGETVRILARPDLAVVKSELQRLWDDGFRSLAVVFVHSYAYPEHEVSVGALAAQMGFSVTLSSAVQPMINVVPRGMSAVADAYLTPVIKQYIDSISANFRGGFESQQARIEFMQSDGGLVDYRKFSGLKAILSGPAGGVVGYAQTSWDDEERVPAIGFDMGGTSTDVSRYAGTYDHVFETTTAGIAIQSPQLDIHTVAAGGGSILTWKNGLFNVGPESASAHPGPACYRKGGPLTVTDANLFLGRLLPEYFPKVFGPKENEPLNREVTEAKFLALTEEINLERQAAGFSPFTAEEVAMGFLKVADEGMARPIRALTEARGYDASAHHLASFGGAGGQHACSVAAVLGISRIVIHKYSSILSAYGMSLADVVHEIQRPAALAYSPETAGQIREQLEDLARQAALELMEQGFALEQVKFDTYLNMRYSGSSSSLMILKGEGWDFKSEFEKVHKREFGFLFADKPILVDDIRVRAIGAAHGQGVKSPYAQMRALSGEEVQTPMYSGTSSVYFADRGRVDTPIYELQSLPVGARIAGPALVIDKTQTIVVAPATTAAILDSYVVIDRAAKDESEARPAEEEFSPIQLSIFGHRFMSIAEQMGRTLQKTAVSTNIKERLDFSCAIFSPDGGLVANAPHVPVHLGSMQFAVRYQHKLWEGKLKDGDVLVSNHPSCGGTHLPDITVITPVFDGETIAFYVASRGHHADIGGILPGSMPPTSSALWQEGAAIESTKLVSAGRFDEAEVRRLLLEEPARHEGCSGTRKLQDNISDLKAQIAANVKGITLIKALIAEFGLPCVHRYMYAIQNTAESAVRELMKATVAKFGAAPLTAVDYMDDGTPIKLTVSIKPEDGSATFDFTGTGPQVMGNTNAPLAITHSAIIYCLRALVADSIPLNQGCLAPIDIIVPERSILNPAAGLAVVGGNVLTSQRVTDVVLKAFRAAAASQGCCNNLTFGTGGKDAVTGEHRDGFGYYETIAGGAGAGPGWEGQSGVHTHMTNTRITDPEVFEKRYPCVLRRFELRAGSGGVGRYKGGDGTVREIEFRVPVQCSILSERRSRRPYGMEGGGEGAAGVNLVVRRDPESGRTDVINLGAKATTKLGEGDRVIIQSPGGGAWGAVEA
ncbi:hydantoinase B/oxoprolinase [Coniochaeta ligniaria NRRL 30616]|uniref:Hydantoinase B/oxoprolinase n=1 Tax=Coniochaeta ligniaria NRRL 30616 TaxID=1408157 RepID=A0A1J7JAZ9_9PEZI|nr:hydantoinase B/oxoprolinase [Coniochaeta ligniaria NRRL 30616]